jgi:hypothetical protein
MNDNINTLKHVLQKEFPNRAVQHQFANDLHTFRLGSDSQTQWLHVARELAEESDMKSSVYHLLNICSAADTLLASTESKWLFLDYTGILEVDESFAVQRSRPYLVSSSRD